MKPFTTYTPFRDLNVGDFMFVRPHIFDLVLLWIGGTNGDVVNNEKSEYFKMLKVQCWDPMKK
jgi:hypothetical protein